MSQQQPNNNQPTPQQQPLLPIGHPDFWKQFKR
jgi:hypothetical protein